MRAGVDIGGTSIKLGLVDNTTVVQRLSIPTAPDALDQVVAVLRGWDVGSAGVAAAGLVENGVLRAGLNLPWTDEPLRDRLQEALGVPVVVCMDGEAAALGEWYAGGHGPIHALFCFMLGTGVGGALVVDGRARGAGCGHMLTGEPPVYLEDVASATAIARRAAADHAAQVEAAQPWTDAARAIGIAAAGLANAFLLDVVVMGGGLMRSADRMMGPARAAFDRYVLPVIGRRCTLVASTLGDDAGVIGAACLQP